MAEVDPDQEAALRRLRAAFGFVEVLRIIVHEQDQVDGALDEEAQQPPAAEGCASAAVAEGADRGYRTLRWSAPLLELDNGSIMMRPIHASQDGQLYAISHQGLRAYLDHLGGLRLSFEHDDGSLQQSMVLSPQETTGLRELLNQDQLAQPADG